MVCLWMFFVMSERPQQTIPDCSGCVGQVGFEPTQQLQRVYSSPRLSNFGAVPNASEEAMEGFPP